MKINGTGANQRRDGIDCVTVNSIDEGPSLETSKFSVVFYYFVF
jgi:hypothetical protein